MKRNDIDNFYTSLVAQKIANGFMITTMNGLNGHQGEITKIGFVKDNELYVAWMTKERVDGKRYWWEEKLVVRFSKWEYPADSNRTVWLSELATINEYNFYQIDRECKWFTPDFYEFEAIHEKRYQRVVANSKFDFYNTKDITSDATKEIAGNYMKRVHGYKRISWDRLSVTKERSHRDDTLVYRVKYNGNSYTLR